jgi:predicted GIY-YIG superfamily endonuclease
VAGLSALDAVLGLWRAVPVPPERKTWHVYILTDSLGVLRYTGISTNVPRRLAQHQSGKGAKCVRGWGRPLRLVCCSPGMPHREAAQLEIAVKRLSSTDKLRLIVRANALESKQGKISENFSPPKPEGPSRG